MKYGSVCSGVEAATVAWHPLGWEPQWFSEIEKFPSAVLAHHYPDVRNYGDMTAFKGWPDDRSIDLLVGGTPCQSFSVAGLRKGLDDPRGNLMLTFLAIAERYRPRWLVWENVPGVLSSNRGKDFGTLLGAMGEIGYGFAYRICDAQYWGVPQRRRRVFVVGYLGDWRRAAAVLFERESLSGHPAPSRKAREETAGTVTIRAESGGGTDEIASTLTARGAGDGNLDPETANYLSWPSEIASTLNAAFGDKQGLEDQHINSGAPLFVPAKPIYASDGQQNAAFSTDQALSPTASREQGYITVPHTVGPLTAGMHKGPRGTEAVESNHVIAFGAQNSAAQGDSVSTEVTPTLDKSKTPAVAIQAQALKENQPKSQGFGIDESGASYTLTAGDRHAMQYKQQVRRLTPKECERLQGFPDDYTQIPYRNKPAENCPDGPRYKSMGNSMAVPVMRWIAERIEMVDKIKDKQ